MIRKSIGLFVVLALMVCMASVVFARGGPPGKKAFTSKAAVVTASPTIATVSVLSGYDVIQNLTTEPRISNALIAVSESAYTAKRLSPTGDWRSTNAISTSATTRSSPTLTKR